MVLVTPTWWLPALSASKSSTADEHIVGLSVGLLQIDVSFPNGSAATLSSSRSSVFFAEAHFCDKLLPTLWYLAIRVGWSFSITEYQHDIVMQQ